MLHTLVNKPIEMLESLVATLEQYEENEKRPRVFAKKADEGEDQKNDSSAEANGDH